MRLDILNIGHNVKQIVGFRSVEGSSSPDQASPSGRIRGGIALCVIGVLNWLGAQFITEVTHSPKDAVLGNFALLVAGEGFLALIFSARQRGQNYPLLLKSSCVF